MNRLFVKAARTLLIGLIPFSIMASCADDLVEPDNAMPDRSKIRNPKDKR